MGVDEELVEVEAEGMDKDDELGGRDGIFVVEFAVDGSAVVMAGVETDGAVVETGTGAATVGRRGNSDSVAAAA